MQKGNDFPSFVVKKGELEKKKWGGGGDDR